MININCKVEITWITEVLCSVWRAHIHPYYRPLSWREDPSSGGSVGELIWCPLHTTLCNFAKRVFIHCFLWVRQRINLLKSSITTKETVWETCSSEHWHCMNSYTKYFKRLKGLLQWTHAYHNFWDIKLVLSKANAIWFTFHRSPHVSFLRDYLTHLRKYDQIVVLKKVEEVPFIPSHKLLH